ncbi:MAG TPA: EAL domain-containing protein [Bacillus bacterium]|nr:EAL domain-containing protein [Bacillus sp. (in: firmicutes)]
MSQNIVSSIIEQNLFDHYRQPIYDLNNDQLAGGELLLRTKLGSPEFIFQQAKERNKLFELDIKSICNAMKVASLFQEQLVFINVFPSTIKKRSFIPFIEQLINKEQLNCNQIVFEINEAEKIKSIDTLRKRVNWLRDIGFQIACDDVGKGAMDLTYMLELNVNFIKLDRKFSNNLVKSTKKQHLIRAILYFCELNGIKVILEGIENGETLLLAKELGVDMGQGYYLGLPELICR